MKPVASLVAFALALAPICAYASPTIDQDAAHAGAHAKPSKRPAPKAVHVAQHRAHDGASAQRVEHQVAPAPSAAPNPALVHVSARTAPKQHAIKSVAKPKQPAGKHGEAPGEAHGQEAHLDPIHHGEPVVAAVLAPLPPPAEHHGDKGAIAKASAHSALKQVLASTHAASKPASPPAAKEEPKEVAQPAAKSHEKSKHADAPKPPCLREMVDVLRGPEEEKLSLTKCDGSLAPFAVVGLSILTRPSHVGRPAVPMATLAKATGPDVSPGIKKIDAGLVERLQAVVDHFGKAGTPAKLSIISGYRPSSAGSYHASGRAIDVRMDGVANEALVAFCKTLPDTGCGYYPNSSFVHLDVRDPGAGHVSWIDASGPGETPRYVSVWPPPAESKQDGDAAAVQGDDHPADQKEPAPAVDGAK